MGYNVDKINLEQQYASTMDSVNLINGGKPERLTDEEWENSLKRNKEHIKIMLSKDFWTDEDLTPFKDAIQ